jgi:hypothetical protein
LVSDARIVHHAGDTVVKAERRPVNVLPYIEARLRDVVLQRTDGTIGVSRL